METVHSRDGTRIAYERSGTGLPLLLVHGAAADHTRWAPVLPALEAHFTVYAMDRRGRGSSGDAAEYAIQREFEDVAALVDSIGGAVNVLGHSHGALCSLEAALLTPNLGRLILYEPPPPGLHGLDPQLAARLQALLDAGDREGLLRAFLREAAGLSAYELALMESAPSWPARVAAAHTILREFRAQESLPPFDPRRFSGVTVSVLLLLGGDSPPFYSEFSGQLHAALPNSKLVLLPGQRHVAMSTAPDLFAREVVAFLTAPA
jgi:pimeloyl-ACP methyl ester carboxylesterase